MHNSNPPIPVIPRFALEMASRIENQGKLPGESILQAVQRVFPQLELVDAWEVTRGIMAMFRNTPDQIGKLDVQNLS